MKPPEVTVNSKLWFETKSTTQWLGYFETISGHFIGNYNNISHKNDLNEDAHESYHNLTACIECYACLDGCPIHAKNNIVDVQNNVAYKYGNPYSLLKIQRLLIDPLTPESEKDRLIDKAKSLGLDIYRREYKNLKIKCGVGINLKGEVIKPLLDAAFGDKFEKENQ